MKGTLFQQVNQVPASLDRTSGGTPEKKGNFLNTAVFFQQQQQQPHSSTLGRTSDQLRQQLVSSPQTSKIAVPAQQPDVSITGIQERVLTSSQAVRPRGDLRKDMQALSIDHQAKGLALAKSLPSLNSSRGQPSNQGPGGVSITGMHLRHSNNFLNNGLNNNSVHKRPRKFVENPHNKSGEGKSNPLFIQSFEQQQIQNSSSTNNLDDSVCTVIQNQEFKPLFYERRMGQIKMQNQQTENPSQRYFHLQQSSTSNSGRKSKRRLIFNRPDAQSCNNSTAGGNHIKITNRAISDFTSNSNTTRGCLTTHHNHILRCPESSSVGNQPQQLSEKQRKYIQIFSKFAAAAKAQGVLSTGSLISTDDSSQLTLKNFQQRSEAAAISTVITSQANSQQRQHNLQQQALINMHMATRMKNVKKNVAGFRTNFTPGSTTGSNSINDPGATAGNTGHQNMLGMVFKGKKRGSNGGQKMPPSSIQVTRKDLIDRPLNHQRPQTVQSANRNSRDISKDRILLIQQANPALLDSSFSFLDDKSMQNKLALSSLIKEILLQRSLQQKKQQLQENQKDESQLTSFNSMIYSFHSGGSDLRMIEPVGTKSLGDPCHHIQDIINKSTNMLIEDLPQEDYNKLLQDWLALKNSTNTKDQEKFYLLSEQLSYPSDTHIASLRNLDSEQSKEVQNIQRYSREIVRKRLTGRLFKGASKLSTFKKQPAPESQVSPIIVKMTGELVENQNLKAAKIYPEAKIEIFHTFKDDQTPYREHPINKVIAMINSFIYATFRSKAAQSSSAQLDFLKPEFKKLNIIMPPKNMPLTASFIRTKEFLSHTKYQLMSRLCSAINQSNDFDPKNYGDTSSQYLKYFVGRGNNDHIVKIMLKQRFASNWSVKDRGGGGQQTNNGGGASQIDNVWLLEETPLEDVNFIWTQVKRQHIVNGFETEESRKSHQEAQNDKSRKNIVALLKQIISEKSSPEKKEDGDHQQQQQPPRTLNKYANILRLYGKLEYNYHLSNKKALFSNMKLYYEAIGQDPFDVLPLTFHIKTGLGDPEYADFKSTFEEFAKNTFFKNVWIVKPGENTNRGTGIQVCNTLREVESIIKNSGTNNSLGYSTYIVQKYIERPLLIKRRKFDIRCYGLFSSIAGVQKGYFYNDGYIRTSCKEYNTNNLTNKFIHLTNDAIQKKSDDYGKFENGNKMSFKEFQKYLDLNYSALNVDFYRDILPQIKKLVQDTFRAVYGKLDADKRLHGFEVFGYDFMIDEDFRICLIEVNTNPCLETSCPLLARIISEMLDNSFKISFDPFFFHTLVNQQPSSPSPFVTSFTQQQQSAQQVQAMTPASSQSTSVVQKKPPNGTTNGGPSGGINTGSVPTSGVGLLQSITDLTITLIKYELVFDEKVEGQYLKDKVLSKTMQTPENMVMQEEEEEEEKIGAAKQPEDGTEPVAVE